MLAQPAGVRRRRRRTAWCAWDCAASCRSRPIRCVAASSAAVRGVARAAVAAAGEATAQAGRGMCIGRDRVAHTQPFNARYACMRACVCACVHVCEC